ncbi:hypothetical protein V9L05_09275 [Bernardetia sp. Wsw4-3y2]|uniref:hypothetical protein n=1 Tax=Bernardetia sp. Wsw4-3y2 TaxID=3127471 RepID=UPI0030D41A36
MRVFQFFLVFLFISIFIYTLIVVINDGWILFDIFLSQIKQVDWAGQFNLDFSTYLVLSGLWAAWRNNFSGGGVLLGIVCSILGMVVFAPYLIWLSIEAKGNMKEVLLGKIRAVN